MNTRQPSTGPGTGFDRAGAIYPAIATSVLAVLLSVAVPVYFPWHGSTEQQSRAASISLLVLMGIVLLGVVGLVLSIVGVSNAGKGHSVSSAVAAGIAILTILILIGSISQLCVYVLMFAFIGG